MKNVLNLKKIFLLAGDLAVLYLALYLTLALRYQMQPTNELWADHFWPFTIVFAAWLLIFYIFNLYNLHLAVNNSYFFRLTNRAIVVSVLLSLAFFYAIPQIKIAPKINLLIYIIVFYVFFFLWRRTYNLALKSYLPKKHIAIIGFDDGARELINELKSKPHLGYIISFILNNSSEDNKNSDYHGIKILNKISDLDELIIKNKISDIVIGADPRQSEELRAKLFNCLPLKINYISLPHFYETITGRIQIDTINQMWFLENLSEANKAWFDKFKRFYDVALALIIFFATLIFWPIIGVVIRSESKGPVFFKQKRVGRNNITFRMIKFRTMTEDNNDQSPTVNGDKRVTKFGSFLRKTRIDEIPQVLNILNGEMSFIGPRPERPELAVELEKNIPFYKERMLIKPGITGWDQVSGEYHSPSQADTIKKLQYDLFYIKNRSVYLDLSILLKTVLTVLSRGGL